MNVSLWTGFGRLPSFLAKGCEFGFHTTLATLLGVLCDLCVRLICWIVLVHAALATVRYDAWREISFSHLMTTAIPLEAHPLHGGRHRWTHTDRLPAEVMGNDFQFLEPPLRSPRWERV